MSYALRRHLRQTWGASRLIRAESTLTSLTQDELVFSPPASHWSKVIRDAEKTVGYPTSFMNLRWLLSDEFANMALYLRKLVGSDHPILQTAKTVLYNEQNNLQPWGLTILLLANSVDTSKSKLPANTLAENQRILAELTEMIRTGHYVHRGLLNINIKGHERTETDTFGNKIALLIGDYLLVTANGLLARLRNQDLSYLISTALRDVSEGEFYGQRDLQNFPLPGQPLQVQVDEYHITCDSLQIEVQNTLGYPVREWTVRSLYNGGSLLGRGCQSAMLLAGQDIEHQETAYLFGAHLCLVWQAVSELQKFTSKDKNTFSLVSAPVLFALNSNPEIYNLIEPYSSNSKAVDYDLIRHEVLTTDAVERTRLLYEENADKAIEHIGKFGDNKCVQTVKNMVKAL